MSMCHTRSRERGTTIAHMGCELEEFIGIVEGCVEIDWAGVGQQSYHIQLFWPGDWIGEYALITGKPRRVSAVAKTDVVLAIIPVDRMIAMLQESPVGWHSIADLANQHMALALDSLVNRLHPRSDTKCAAVLLNLAHPYRASRRRELSVPITQSELAQLTCLSRNSVGTALRKLQDRQLIEVKYSCINILDLPGLVRHVDRLVS